MTAIARVEDRSWRDRIAPEGYAFPGDPRGWEQTNMSGRSYRGWGGNF